MSTAGLKPDQIAFLEKCNTDFADRFTDADEEFKKIYDSEIPPPPIMCPWYRKPKMNRGRGGHGSRYREYNRYDNRDNYDDRRDRYNRDGGGGGDRYRDQRQSYH